MVIYIYIYISKGLQCALTAITIVAITIVAIYNTIHMYSGITSGRVLNGELLYTKILEVNLFAFAYRLFRRDFSPLDGTYLQMKLKSLQNSLGKCKQINF